jgi:type I restriction enzyme M protein
MASYNIYEIIDNLWPKFRSNNIYSPLVAIDKVTSILFYRLIDQLESILINYQSLMPEILKSDLFINNQILLNHNFFNKKQEHLRWKNLINLSNNQLSTIINTEVIPFLQNFDNDTFLEIINQIYDFENYYSDFLAAYLNSFPSFNTHSSLSINSLSQLFGPDALNSLNPSLNYNYKKNMLQLNKLLHDISLSYLNIINKGIHLEISDQSLLKSIFEFVDIFSIQNHCEKRKLFNYLLSYLSNFTIKNSIITPNIINFILVEIFQPQENLIIGDPACGTGGLMIEVLNYLRRNKKTHISNFIQTFDQDSTEKRHAFPVIFRCFDIDQIMVRLCFMNFLLHGITEPSVFYQDTLADSFLTNFQLDSNKNFDLILSDIPQFMYQDNQKLSKILTKNIKSKQTELLFLIRILLMLKPHGRCGIIIPETVLLDNSNAYINLRSILLEQYKIDAIFFLNLNFVKQRPPLKTTIIVITNEPKTEEIFFLKAKIDNIEENISDFKQLSQVSQIFSLWKDRKESKNYDCSEQAFFVPINDIHMNNNILHIDQYQQKRVVFDDSTDPLHLLNEMEEIESEISLHLKKIRAFLADWTKK